MNIFNSLGSNYNFDFVIKALTLGNNPEYSSKLKSYLEEKYQGKAVLTYKGREALELALKLLSLPEKSSVVINGYTCYAVYKAVSDANLKPEYLDIEKGSLDFSPSSLEAKLKENSNIKVVIIQNTLGYPCDIEEIAKLCKKHKVFLIEDLAHSAGANYSPNQQAGEIGDFVVLSFSQDKIIDGISGGALIIKNPKYENSDLPKFEEVPLTKQFIDRFYPLLTYLVRRTYPFGLGKIIHSFLKKAGLLSNPMGGLSQIHNLPDWYSSLALASLKNLPANLKHRKEIALIYSQNLDPEILYDAIVKNINRSTTLRFPIFIENRSNLISYLKKYGIFVSDIWYDAPIAPKKYMSQTDYKGQCKQSESVSDQILNLPTHQNISSNQAKEIADKINEWLKLQ